MGSMDINKIILQLLNDKSGKEDYRQLESWKEETAENVKWLEDMHAVWPLESEMGSYQQFDSQKGWRKIMRPKGNRVLKMAALGAAFILLATATVYYLFIRETPLSEFQSTDDPVNVALMDDSQIWLNTQTRLKVENDFAEVRLVSLSGEAYFNIAKDARPFRVMLEPDVFVEVLGTSFNIDHSGNGLAVQVYSGRVAVHVLDRDVILEKGDGLKEINGNYVKFRFNDRNTLSYVSQSLVFEDTPLDKVLKDIGRHYKIEFIMGQSVLLPDCVFSSTMINQSLSEVLNELEKIFQLSYTKHENRIVIDKVKC